MGRSSLLVLGLCWACASLAQADVVFVEAESFEPSSSGWKVARGDQSRRASRAATLWGAEGPEDAVAVKRLAIDRPGVHRIWVRSQQVAAWRGPFRASVSVGDRELAATVVDLVRDEKIADWNYGWQSFDAELPRGEITLRLSKHERKNSPGYVRHVDCFWLTDDLEAVPDHVPYGPQTFVRVRLGAGYERPAYLHLFADHYRDPWYAHYAIGRGGVAASLAPPEGQLLRSGESSPWSNLSPTIYQDSGAALNFSIRHSYREKAARFRATLEFARPVPPVDPRANDEPGVLRREAFFGEMRVVKTFDVEAEPNGVVIVAPPDLESDERVAHLRRDREYADEIGRRADAFDWPTFGRRPLKLPFLVTANIGGYELPVDRAVSDRERKTLDYFGFNGSGERLLHGLWIMRDGSYCAPDAEAMRERARHEFEQFRKSGRSADAIVGAMLMDEPTGQPARFAAQDAAYRFRFREWLAKKSLTPELLRVRRWDEVRPVSEDERTKFPALHYYTQLFRTRALGDFLATQREILEETYGRSFPVFANFSDGAVYHANFTGQGVDYFELLDDPRQNAIWGEDWANNASTYQCAAYNVALMQAAAQRRGQTIGHYLVAHAGRTPWDVQTKAIGETARGVRIWKNFSYGPVWGSHEGGPAWKSHLWQGRPESWRANAETTRLLGAAEDWLLAARPTRSQTAVLYSSSSDIWTMTNYAYGFDRMHAWLAFAHAQIPVDLVSEREVEAGGLGTVGTVAPGSDPSGFREPYRVVYLSGPNLTRGAAEKLRAWVEAGGTLVLTAGAALRDEFDRPLDGWQTFLPVEREAPRTLDPFVAAGRFLDRLPVRDTVVWDETRLDVVGVKQELKPGPEARVLATFQDGRPAVVAGAVQKGRVVVCGFLPALAYVRPALAARHALEARVAKGGEDAAGIAADARELLERSYDPWEFPADVRERLLAPVRDAGVAPRATCDAPLVDLVAIPCRQGLLLACANHSLRPLAGLRIVVRDADRLAGAVSTRHGELPTKRTAAGLEFALPLDAADFVMLAEDAGANAAP